MSQPQVTYLDLFEHAAIAEQQLQDKRALEICNALVKAYGRQGVRLDKEGNLVISVRKSFFPMSQIAALIENEPVVSERTYIEGLDPKDKFGLQPFDEIFITPKHFYNLTQFVQMKQKAGEDVPSVLIATTSAPDFMYPKRNHVSGAPEIECRAPVYAGDNGEDIAITPVMTPAKGNYLYRNNGTGVLAYVKPRVEREADSSVRLVLPLEPGRYCDWTPDFDRRRASNPEVRNALEL